MAWIACCGSLALTRVPTRRRDPQAVLRAEPRGTARTLTFRHISIVFFALSTFACFVSCGPYYPPSLDTVTAVASEPQLEVVVLFLCVTQ